MELAFTQIPLVASGANVCILTKCKLGVSDPWQSDVTLQICRAAITIAVTSLWNCEFGLCASVTSV